MTPSKLKYEIESRNPDSKFFSRNNMRFAGDRMSNYKVAGPTEITTYGGETVAVWELQRKRPVKHGLQASAYFDCESFAQTFPAK